MTVDTAAARAQATDYRRRFEHDETTTLAYDICGQTIPALCDALDTERAAHAETAATLAAIGGADKATLARRLRRRNVEIAAAREQVRLLERIGARIVESEVSRRPGLQTLAIEELRAALAVVGGEGGAG